MLFTIFLLEPSWTPEYNAKVHKTIKIYIDKILVPNKKDLEELKEENPWINDFNDYRTLVYKVNAINQTNKRRQSKTKNSAA